MSEMESLLEQTSTMGLSETPVTPAAETDTVEGPADALAAEEQPAQSEADEPKSEQDQVEPSDEATAEDEPDQQQMPPDTGGAPIKVFVGGLDPSWGLTADDLRKHFERFGAVQDVLIKAPSSASIRGQRGITCAPRGYAFVSIRDPAVAKEIVSKAHVIHGNTVPPPMYAKSNYPRGGYGGRTATRPGAKGGEEHKGYGPVYDEAGSCLKVFIGGLGHDVTEESFRAFFEQFGTLTDSVIMHDFVTRRPRGFGFVAYSKRSSVDKLLEQQYYELNGRRIEVKLAVPRERLAQQEADGYAKPAGKPRAGAKAGGLKGRAAEYTDGQYGGTDGYYVYSMEQEPGNGVVVPVYSFDSYTPEPAMSPISPMGPNAYIPPTGIPVQLGMMPPPMAMAPAAPTGKGMLGPAHASQFVPMCMQMGYAPPPGFGAPPMYQMPYMVAHGGMLHNGLAPAPMAT